MFWLLSLITTFIRDVRNTFVASGSKLDSITALVEGKHKGYTTSLHNSRLENKLDVEVEDIKLSSILS
jgi:hypothetical protein